MAMSAEDKAEMKELLSDGMALGIAKFRSAVEEETAKNPPTETPATPPAGGSKNDDNPFSFAGFVLGK